LAWAIAFGIGLSCIFALDTHEYNATGTQPSQLARVLFNTFQRAGWAVALGWLIFACFHGYGGMMHINLLLTH